MAPTEAVNENAERKPGRAWLGYLLVAVATLGTASFAVGCYVGQFGDSLSASQTRWGEFGDYLGGVLSPIFALIGLFVLLRTVSLQTRELELSTAELQKSASALREQSDSLRRQNFERTFFEMVRLQHDIITGTAPAGQEVAYSLRYRAPATDVSATSQRSQDGTGLPGAVSVRGHSGEENRSAHNETNELRRAGSSPRSASTTSGTMPEVMGLWAARGAVRRRIRSMPQAEPRLPGAATWSICAAYVHHRRTRFDFATAYALEATVVLDIIHVAPATLIAAASRSSTSSLKACRHLASTRW